MPKKDLQFLQDFGIFHETKGVFALPQQPAPPSGAGGLFCARISGFPSTLVTIRPDLALAAGLRDNDFRPLLQGAALCKPERAQ
ncbi:hypothetical protein HBA54_03100 [Pelagibius litoralis]|uniref:Uncharacterized protein n=1 Tax=Pelagibius litoralis TaxID=374515 RepID=A0A967C362_9PROT|nr:hypothetical protein [Pelagibius litoralis]NIA67569.1 hypothetical protein [Pelagibius litoralis]